MKALRSSTRMLFAALGCAMVACTAVGCQTSIAGQTLPSAYYLTDDMQYYTHGPENQYMNQINSIEQNNLQRAGMLDSGEPTP